MSDEDATRMLETFRHVELVWRVADVSTTSRACQTHGVWRMTHAKSSKLVTRMSQASGVSTMMLRGNSREFRLNSISGSQRVEYVVAVLSSCCRIWSTASNLPCSPSTMVGSRHSAVTGKLPCLLTVVKTFLRPHDAVLVIRR